MMINISWLKLSTKTITRVLYLCFTVLLFFGLACAEETKITNDSPSGTLSSVLEQIKLEHKRVLDEMDNKASNSKPLELDDPKMPALLKKGWQLAGKWASEFLETHPNPSDKDLEAIFAGFTNESKPKIERTKYSDYEEYQNYRFFGSAVRLGLDVYIINAMYVMDFPATGTFMIVTHNKNGRFETLWDIKTLAEVYYAKQDEIGRWVHLTSRSYYNGPMSVDRIIPLQPLPNGHSRFLVNAYQCADGGTTLYQLSIWEWDGAIAYPIYINLYSKSFDTDGLSYDGKVLKIGLKEDLKTFFSCGMCPEPKAVWTIIIEKDRIVDKGHSFETPELKWADDLFSRVIHNRRTTGMASPHVVKRMKALIRRLRSESYDKKYVSFGMLDKCRVIRRNKKGGEFILVTDDVHARFKYVMRNGKPYFTFYK